MAWTMHAVFSIHILFLMIVIPFDYMCFPGRHLCSRPIRPLLSKRSGLLHNSQNNALLTGLSLPRGGAFEVGLAPQCHRSLSLPGHGPSVVGLALSIVVLAYPGKAACPEAQGTFLMKLFTFWLAIDCNPLKNYCSKIKVSLSKIFTKKYRWALDCNPFQNATV